MNRCINVYFKTNKTIIKINDDASKREIIQELNERIKDLKKFYKEENIPIFITGKVLKSYEIEEIEKLIKSELNINIEFETPKSLGIHEIKRTYEKDVSISETKYYKGSIRSGQKLEFEGSIVIIGDINDGAEVIAEDNIIVLGSIRGMAHAGAKGNQNAIISAVNIQSPQIRIASSIKERSRKEIEHEKIMYAYIKETGKIVLE